MEGLEVSKIQQEAFVMRERLASIALDNGALSTNASYQIADAIGPMLRERGVTKISPELVARMEQLVRDLHEDHIKHGAHDYVQDFVSRAAAIVADLPKPVDPDLIEARRVAEHRSSVRGYLYPLDAFCQGHRDDGDDVQIALAAIKRGRALASSGNGGGK